MKEGMLRPEAKREQREQGIPQHLIDEAFEDLARVYWTLPKVEDAEEKWNRFTRAVAASLAGVDASEIKSNGTFYYYGEDPWKNGAIQIDLEEIAPNVEDGEIELSTRLTKIDHHLKENPSKKGFLRLKVSTARFAELKEKAEEILRAAEERQKKEDDYWMDRRQKALPAFLSFAAGHSRRLLSPEESEPIQPLVEAIRHGKKLEPSEQLLVRREESGAWQFHFYRDGKLYDIHEYEFGER